MDNISVRPDATGERIETRSMGAVAEPADRYRWAQTQCLHHFLFNDDRMPTFGLP